MHQSPRLSAEELGTFSAGVLRISQVSEVERQALLDVCQLRDVPRGQHLLRAGEQATHTGVVLSGLLREYFVMPNGAERTKAFVQAGQCTGSLADLLSSKPSRAFIVAEERTRLVLTSFTTMRAIAERSREWSRFSLRAVEQLFLYKAEREYELLGLDADARYDAFVQRFPGLEARIAARHIASYLGITPVHLSRLRRKRREHRRRVPAALNRTEAMASALSPD